MKYTALFTFNYKGQRLEKGTEVDLDEDTASRLLRAMMIKELNPKRKTKEEKRAYKTK